jgi:hypothetical protein
MAIEDIDLRALCEIRLVQAPTKPVVRIQNWDTQPLLFRGKLWNYAPFPLPELSKKLGSDTTSVSVRLPNYSTAVSGDAPIGTWAQNGTLVGAKVLFVTFSGNADLIQRHRYTIMERYFEESGDPSRSGSIEILMRSTEDGASQILNAVYSISNVYQGVANSPV